MGLQFGVIADAQYADADARINRYYRNSVQKLREAVALFNARGVEYVLNFGDLIDHDFASWEPALDELSRLRMPIYHLAGNHDFSVETQAQKAVVYQLLKMPQRYYSFDFDGWRFVLLDGNELSLYASLTAEQQQEMNVLLSVPETMSNTCDYNGAISEVQLKWLESTLDVAQHRGERVLLCCHFPVLSSPASARLWNSERVLSLLKSPHVFAFLSGHHHHGGYEWADGVHHLTFAGMVETEWENAFSIVSASGEGLTIEGFGRQESRELVNLHPSE